MIRLYLIINRFFFSRYWGLHKAFGHKTLGRPNWSWISDNDKYLGFIIHGRRGQVKISVPFRFDEAYNNLDYALVAMFFMWKKYTQGYKFTPDGYLLKREQKRQNNER